MEEKYASLQEEATAKTKKLKEVWRQFQGTKEEVSHGHREDMHLRHPNVLPKRRYMGLLSPSPGLFSFDVVTGMLISFDLSG